MNNAEYLSEADTKAKFIDPALHKRGWTEDLIRREETERGVEVIEGQPRRKVLGEPEDIINQTKERLFAA